MSGRYDYRHIDDIQQCGYFPTYSAILLPISKLYVGPMFMFGDSVAYDIKKVKVCFYIAQSSPLDRSKRFTRFALPDRPIHSDTNSASPGSILVRQQLRAKTKPLTFPPLSIARYSFIQLSQWRERKCPNFETVAKRDSNPGSPDCESGILPLSYRAPHHHTGSVSPALCIRS